MKGRIKREDLDHLLRLVQTGLPQDIVPRHAGDDADGELSAAQDMFAPDHALWNANHSFWTEKLKSETAGEWTDAQCATAASIINAAEYQHVVFSDIANALTRGLSEGWHSRVTAGDEKFSSRANHSFASLFDETVDLVDASTGQVRQVKLAPVLETVHGPDRPDEHDGGGVDAKDGPTVAESRSAADSVLFAKSVNLGELTGVRSREAGHVSFNQARGELFAQCGLSTLLPYAGWDDFQHRNHLSEDLITDLKAAYPEGFGALDLWVGGLAETPAVGDLGPTIAAAVSAEIAQQKTGSSHSCLDLLAGTELFSEISSRSWSDIVTRHAGAAHLADYMLGGAHAIHDASHNFIFGTAGDDVLIGTDGHDFIFGGAGDDFLDGRGGADVMVGGSGNDTYVVDNVRDRVIEKADGGAHDTILTALNSFALDDSPLAASAPASDDASSPLVPDDPASAGATAVALTSDPATSEGATSDAATSDAETAGGDGDLGFAGSAANVENLTYIGDGGFTGRGNSSDNVLIGGGGDDTLKGVGGDDVLYGRGGDDALYGGSGDDVLYGGYGDDRLDGGTGDDVLYVASGATDDGETADDALVNAYGHDTIVLKPGFGNDVVIGFDANDSHCEGHDRLDVSAYASLTADSIGTEIQITGIGPHTIITINGDSVTLLDVSANTIGKDDFIFS